jgi:hypothetical protein
VIHTLPPRVIRGLSKPADLCEVMCEAVGELTVVQNDHFLLETEPELRLYMDSKSVVLNSTRPSARIGRDPLADLVVGDTQSSRRHAEIELRGDKFVLIDRSSNGTFVQIEGERSSCSPARKSCCAAAASSPSAAAAPTAPRSSASSASEARRPGKPPGQTSQRSPQRPLPAHRLHRLRKTFPA